MEKYRVRTGGNQSEKWRKGLNGLEESRKILQERRKKNWRDVNPVQMNKRLENVSKKEK